MADKKISELTELTTPDGTEELVVNDSGVSKKVQIDNLLAGGTISNFTSTGIDDNATSTAITIDASENVGIGVVPEGWSSTHTAIDIGQTGSIAGQDSANRLYSMSNAYDNSGYKYKTTSQASSHEQSNGAHYFFVAPSGTADSAITWTTSLQLTNDGRGLSQFTAKAWVNWSMATATIADSHNISSITDSSVGDQRPIFTNAMANGNYAAVANGNAMSDWNGTETTVIGGSTTSFRVIHREDNIARDSTYTTAIVFGD